jgi:hypothetical protein
MFHSIVSGPEGRENYQQSWLLSKFLSHCERVWTLRPWGGISNIVIQKWRRCGIFCSLQNKASRTSLNARVGGQSSSQKLVINEHTCTSTKVLLLSGGIMWEEELL